MRIRHQFYEDSREYFVSEEESLLLDDRCIYCNLIITHNVMNDMVKNILYIDNDRKQQFNYLNEKFNCLTEEEFIIKKALE